MNVLEKRKKRIGMILSYLNKLGVMDVDMIMKMNIDGLGDTGKRNVLRVMQRLEDDGYIKSVRKERKLYMLKDNVYKNVNHRLMMNRFLVNHGYVNVVKIEPKMIVNGVKFQPDFIIPKVSNPKKASDWRYFEVDRTQKKKVNMDKVKRYKDLGLNFEIVCGVERVYMWKGYVYHVV